MTETDEQKIIVAWFREEWPEYAHCLRVSMSGMNLGGGRKAAIMVKFMRSMGVAPDESDILIALPRGGFGSLVIEHKSDSGKYEAPDGQIDYIKRHNAVGNCAVVTKGIEAAKAAIIQYMAGDVPGPR